jgi:lauroyl/myristoyl acyltransferase
VEAPPLSWALGSPLERRQWRRYWLSDPLSGAFDFTVHFALKLAPIELCSAIGAALGRHLGPLDRKANARTVSNFRKLWPQLDDAALQRAVRDSWSNVGRTMTEFSALRRLWASDRVTVSDPQHMQALLAAGRPIVFAALHLGNWELLGVKILSLGGDAVEFYQPPRNRFHRAIADKVRKRFADRLLPPGPRSALAATKRLMDGQVLVIFVDEFQRGRVGGPLFGRPIGRDSNLVKAVRFAEVTGADLVPVFVKRVRGARFELCVGRPVAIERGKGHDVLERNARALNAALEPVVLEHLDQWFMLHELRDLAASGG